MESSLATKRSGHTSQNQVQTLQGIESGLATRHSSVTMYTHIFVERCDNKLEKRPRCASQGVTGPGAGSWRRSRSGTQRSGH